MTSSVPGQSRCERHLQPGKMACLHSQARHARVDNAVAAPTAVVHREVAHPHCSDRHLPIAILRVIHRKPPERSCELRRIVSTKVQLAAVCSKGKSELGQHIPRALKQPPEETADRTRGQALQPEADDAVVGHGPEGHILQAEGCQQGQVYAGLATSPRTDTQAVAHKHRLGVSLSQVGLGVPNRDSITPDNSPGQTVALLDLAPIGVHVHCCR
mmetsp:Transcript_108967/g.274216  ORF Transcript_108967/g.274216 Transcript_108967/m.274216 type:complete len:214 (-) Transcript_108967:458-1099(-)